jgi:hypothetical protein
MVDYENLLSFLTCIYYLFNLDISRIWFQCLWGFTYISGTKMGTIAFVVRSVLLNN